MRYIFIDIIVCEVGLLIKSWGDPRECGSAMVYAMTGKISVRNCVLVLSIKGLG